MTTREANRLALLSAVAVLERRCVIDVDALTPLELKAYAFLRSRERDLMRAEVEHLKEALRQLSRDYIGLLMKVENDKQIRQTRRITHPDRRRRTGTAQAGHHTSV